MHAFEWPIDDIIAAHPGLYLEHCAVMAVTVMSHLSQPPCEFVVECGGFSPPDCDGQTQFLLQVGWDDRLALKAERLARTEQRKPVVERAAVALAALCFAHLIPDGRMRVTDEGDRADYWLPSLQSALEVSGTEHEREVPRRQREKIVQVLDNPRGWNGYVFVCCASNACRRILWSYHKQEERSDAASQR